MGIPQDSVAGREQFELRMEQRRSEEMSAAWKSIRRGWCLGEEAFRQELLAQMGGQMGEHHYGMERWESMEEKAVRIVREELAKAGWTEKGTGHAAQRRPGESGGGRTAAAGNDGNAQVDQRASANGRLDAPEQTAI